MALFGADVTVVRPSYPPSSASGGRTNLNALGQMLYKYTYNPASSHQRSQKLKVRPPPPTHPPHNLLTQPTTSYYQISNILE